MNNISENIEAEDEKKIIIRLEPELHKKIKLLCIEQDVSLQDIYHNAITDIVINNKNISHYHPESQIEQKYLKNIMIRCSLELHKQFKMYCFNRDITMQQMGYDITLHLLCSNSTN